MSTSSQQDEVDVPQNDQEEDVSPDLSDSLGQEHGETEAPPPQEIENTDVEEDANLIPEKSEERIEPLGTCDDPGSDFHTISEKAASNDDVVDATSVSEKDEQDVVDALSEPETDGAVNVPRIQSAKSAVDDGVPMASAGALNEESEAMGNHEEDALSFDSVGEGEMSTEDANCDGVVPCQEEVLDGDVLDSHPFVQDDEPRPSSIDIDIAMGSSLDGPLDSEEGGASICLEEAQAVSWEEEPQQSDADEEVQETEEDVQLEINEDVPQPGAEICLEEEQAASWEEEARQSDADEEVQENEQDVQLEINEDVPQAGEEMFEEPDIQEASIPRSEDTSENRAASLDESTTTIPNAERLTPPVSPMILKAKRDEDGDLSETNPLLTKNLNEANTADLRKHVALSIPTNKVAAAFLRAQARMTRVQEEEKGGYLSKSCWTSIVLGFRRLKEWSEGVSLWSDRIQGYGLDRTWFLYGGYNYPTGARFGGWYWYQPEIAFPLAIAGMYGASFFAVLYVIWSRMSGSGDASTIEQNQTYPFSSVVFASWDFHLRHKSAARTLQNAIRKQIGEMLQDASWDEMRLTLSQKLMKGMTKIIGTLVFWPMTVALTAAALYYIIDEGEVLNEYFGTGFAQSIAITLVSMISQIAVRSTVKYEGWHPRITQQVEAMKLFSVKAVNLGVILYQLYSIQEQATEASSSLSLQLSSVVGTETEDLQIVTSSLATNLTESIRQLDVCDLTLETNACERGFTCCHESCTTMFGSQSLKGRCVPVCEENEMGLIFYRLSLTNGIIISFQEVITTFFMSRILHRPPEMDGSKFFVNIIETQALVWLGSPSAPLLPFFGVLSNLLTFYLKTWMALRLYNPPSNTCSASRNSNILYTLMLVTLLLCSLPMSTTFSRERDICGPHKGRTMAWAVSNKVRNAPNWIKSVIYWITNPMILGGLVMLLLFSLLFQVALKNRWRKNARDYKGEFTKYRRDMQAKMVESRKTTNRNTPAGSMNSSFTSTRQILKDTKLEIRTAESYTPLKPKSKRK
ncbi:hypothetical protein BSKO_13764 [Bryopsis sp. KO-2023]|nr:hypothetical protein BSKO_13764 [Bryopsis sp. KO-2023]